MWVCAVCGLWAASCAQEDAQPNTRPEVQDPSFAQDAGPDLEADLASDLAPDAAEDMGEDMSQDAAEDAAEDAGDQGPGRVQAFVAQGHLGRTTVSCDGGQTWVAERSDDAMARCWTPDVGPDCDHTSGAGRGIASDGQAFIATFGWGAPGAIRRSEDGAIWQDVLPGKTFGGVAYGQGVWLAAARNPMRSTDGGRTWQDAGPSMMKSGNVRRAGFVEAGGGLFVIVGEAGDVVVSTDAQTWRAAQVPDGCGRNIQTEGGIAALGEVILILGGDGSACVSSDGGQSWTLGTTGGDITSHLVVHNGRFMAWSQGKRYTSVDGLAWTIENITPHNVTIGPAAAGGGRLVGVRGGWQVWYEKQEFYRSADGLAWEVLPAGSFTGGHPIRAIAYGELVAGGACP
jgi:hypothetical protein